MHPEIEKLIDLALADGQITEKERNVILKKAAENGVDADEVEMIIDAKMHLKEKETIGSQIKCPSCGKRISGLAKTCSCGYVFNTGSIQESKSLESAIETLENLIIQVRGLSSTTSKEVIESLIARVEKEIRFIKTRYSDNNEIKKLLSELEIISDKYINKALKKSKRRRYILFSIFIFFGGLFLFFYIKGSAVISKKESTLNEFNYKCDSIDNPKLKETIRETSSLYKTWDNFKKVFFENYPDYDDGYVHYCSIKYQFNEKITYKIADNQFSLIQKKFKTPIDFILYDDKNNFRALESTQKADSLFLLTIISANQWEIKKIIDNKIKLIQNTELLAELQNLNSSDSINRSILTNWDDNVNNYILKKQNGTYPREGYLTLAMGRYEINEEVALNYCNCRLEYYKANFKCPLDFFLYRDNCYYANKQSKQDDQNAEFCKNKFKLKNK